MEENTNLDSKSIYKALYKCSGSENVARHFLVHGDCPEGLFSVDFRIPIFDILNIFSLSRLPYVQR